MPTVTTNALSDQPIDRVWRELLDIEAYPSYMEEVREVHILQLDGNTRRSTWSVLLKGSILEWEEEERIDHEQHTIDFDQIEGDLAYFTGQWRVFDQDGRTATSLHVDFDIGIPLLADMLNPVAARALDENAQKIFSRIDIRAAR